MNNIEMNEGYKEITIDEIKNNLHQLNIESIEVGGINELVGFGDEIDIETKDNFSLKLFVSTWGSALIINYDWYQNHKEEVEELLNYVATNTKEYSLNIRNKILINDNIIDCLCQNRNITSVDLASHDIDRYELTKETYEKFKKSSIKRVRTSCVAEELKENYDDIIAFNCEKNLIQNLKYQDIIRNKDIEINKKLTGEELNNFKYLTNEKNIIIDEKLPFSEVEKIVIQLKKLELSCKIIIKVKDNEQFNSMIFNKQIPEYNELYVDASDSQILLRKYIELEKLLYEMIEPAKDLSPFEKYIYAYNVVKKYRKYNGEGYNSRKLYDVLQSEYIVCAGFANLLESLLAKLGINSSRYDVDIDTSYDEIDNRAVIIEPEEKATTKSGHARLMVYLKDEKYNIDGYYISDPTWNNHLDKDTYTCMAMTHEEMSMIHRYNWLKRSDLYRELLNVNSTDEFYEKAIFVLTRDKEKYNITDVKIMVENIINEIKLDKKFINKLYMKYPGINSYEWKFNVNELVYDIACYIVSHNNKTISIDTIMDGIKNVYEKAYGYTGEKLRQELSKTQMENYELYKKQFPTLYKIDSDNNTTFHMNEENKFETEEVRKKI